MPPKKFTQEELDSEKLELENQIKEQLRQEYEEKLRSQKAESKDSEAKLTQKLKDVEAQLAELKPKEEVPVRILSEKAKNHLYLLVLERFWPNKADKNTHHPMSLEEYEYFCDQEGIECKHSTKNSTPSTSTVAALAVDSAVPEKSVPSAPVLPPKDQIIVDQHFELEALRETVNKESTVYIPPPKRSNQGEGNVADRRGNNGANGGHANGGNFGPDVVRMIVQEMNKLGKSDHKVSIPEFSGETNGDAYLDWLIKVESIFNLKAYGDPKRVQLIETKLQNGATHWWKNLQQERRKLNQPQCWTWEEMQRLMRAQFVPGNYMDLLAERIAQLRQGDKTVTAYHDEFYTLANRAQLLEPDFVKIGRFKSGLNENIRNLLQIYDVHTMSGAFQAALRCENILANNKESTLNKVSLSVAQGASTSVATSAQPNNALKATETWTGGNCYHCKKPGHRASMCPDKTTLLVQPDEEPDDMEEKVTGCSFEELENYPTVHIDPYFDYGPDCYELPLPRASSTTP